MRPTVLAKSPLVRNRIDIMFYTIQTGASSVYLKCASDFVSGIMWLIARTHVKIDDRAKNDDLSVVSFIA